MLSNETTEKVFRIAYKVAKENQSFHNFETVTVLRELNGLNMGKFYTPILRLQILWSILAVK